MKPSLLFALALSLAAGSASAQPLTLREAVAEALERNPRATAARAGIDAAAARVTGARSAWLPRAEITASSTRSNNPVFVFGSLLEQGRFGQQHFDPAFLNDPDPLRNDRLSLSVRYALFDQLRRPSVIRQSRNAAEQAGAGDREIRQQIRLDVLRAVYGVVLAEQRLSVAASAVRAAEAETSAIRDRLEQGLVVASDLLSTQVHLDGVRQQQTQAEGELAIARAALATLLRRPHSASVDVEASLTSREFPVIALDAAIARALATRGPARIARAAAENARLDVRIARGSLLPRLDAYASWGSSGSTFTASGSDHAFGFAASLDLFDGARFTRIAEARAGAEAASASAAAAEDAVTMEVVTAFHRLRSAEQRVVLATRAAEQAAAAARIIKDRFANGLTTITEQLRAETTLVAARLDVLSARYDRITGYAELLRAMGELDEIDSFS